MIGRLGVSQSVQGKNLETDVLDFIKAWLVDPMNKTGCRFVLVDSYNQEKNFKFYERNGFKFLFSSEEQEREFRDLKPDRPLNTRLMYFDLIELLNWQIKYWWQQTNMGTRKCINLLAVTIALRAFMSQA